MTQLLRRADHGDPSKLHPGAAAEEGEEGEEGDDEGRNSEALGIGVSPAGRGNGGRGKSNARNARGGGRRCVTACNGM